MASQIPAVHSRGLADLFGRCFSFCYRRQPQQRDIVLAEGLSCLQPHVSITETLALKVLGMGAPCLKHIQVPWQEHAVVMLTMPEEGIADTQPLLSTRRHSKQSTFTPFFLETIEEEKELSPALAYEQAVLEQKYEKIFSSLGKMMHLEAACDYLLSCYRSAAPITADLLKEVHALCYEDRLCSLRTYPLTTQCLVSGNRLFSSTTSLFSQSPAPLTEFERLGFGRVQYSHATAGRLGIQYIYQLQHLEVELGYRLETAIKEFKSVIAHVPCLAMQQRKSAYFQAALQLYLNLERLQPMGFGVRAHYLVFCYVLARYDLGCPFFFLDNFLRESTVLCNILDEKDFTRDVIAAIKRGEEKLGAESFLSQSD